MKPYHREQASCPEYELLVGPDFECLLTEPEDRTWYRDGRDVVDRLNEQHEEIARLRDQIATELGPDLLLDI